MKEERFDERLRKVQRKCSEVVKELDVLKKGEPFKDEIVIGHLDTAQTHILLADQAITDAWK